MQNKPLKVLYRDWTFEDVGIFGIGRNDNNTNGFIQSILDEQEEQVVVFTFDQ